LYSFTRESAFEHVRHTKRLTPSHGSTASHIASPSAGKSMLFTTASSPLGRAFLAHGAALLSIPFPSSFPRETLEFARDYFEGGNHDGARNAKCMQHRRPARAGAGAGTQALL
jgi:hypothetical protein